MKALPPLGTNNFAYRVSVNDKEWYVFENRQLVKWDSGLPNHGMLVWHIEYDGVAWRMDALNDIPGHQRVDIVEAGTLRVNSQSGGYRIYGGGATMADDPFPGSQNVTKLSPVLAWDSSEVLAGLFNITEPDTNVCFVLDSNVAINECVFVMPLSSSSEPESSSSSEESSSSVTPQSSSCSTSEPTSSSMPESSSSSEPQTSSSSEPGSSSSTTIVNHVLTGAEFRVALVGRVLDIVAPEMGVKVVRIFDLQGNVLASVSFAGTSYRLDIGAVARGTTLVVRLESGNRAKNFVVR